MQGIPPEILAAHYGEGIYILLHACVEQRWMSGLRS